MTLNRPRSPYQTRLTRPVPITWRAIGSITDDFDDNTFNLSKYNWFTGAGTTINETTQQLVCTYDTTAGGAYSGLNFNSGGQIYRVSVLESEALFQIADYGTILPNLHIYLLYQLPLDPTHRVCVQYVGSSDNWTFFYRVGGGTVTVGTYTGRPAWIRLTNTSGVFRCYASATGSSWTELGTGLTLSEPWMDAAVVQLAYGHLATEASANSGKLDNFNNLKTSSTASGLAVPVTLGAPDLTLKSSLSANGLAVPVALGAPTLTLTANNTLTANGLPVPVTFGAAGLARGPISLLSDGFNDNLFDTATYGKGGDLSDCTVEETNQRIELTTTNATATRSAIFISNARYSLRDNAVHIRVNPGAPQPGLLFYLMLEQVSGNNDRVWLNWSNGTLAAQRMVSNVLTSAATATVTPTWMRLREAGGTLYYEYATTVATPTSGDWLTLASIATPINVGAVRLQINHGHNLSMGTPTSTAWFDNLNLLPASLSATGLAVPIGLGSHALTLTGLFTLLAQGLPVPVTLGPNTALGLRHLYALLVEYQDGEQTIDLGDGAGQVANLETGLVTVDSA